MREALCLNPPPGSRRGVRDAVLHSMQMCWPRPTCGIVSSVRYRTQHPDSLLLKYYEWPGGSGRATKAGANVARFAFVNELFDRGRILKPPKKDSKQAGFDEAALMWAMGNAKRLQILKILSQREVPVAALAEEVGLSQSALSQHLSKLRMQKLVYTRRDAQTIFYRSESKAVQTVLDALATITASEPASANREK